MSTGAPNPSRPIIAGWVTAAIAAGAAAAIWFATPLPARFQTALALPWPLLAVAFAASSVFVVSFEMRRQAVQVSVEEVPLLVGLVFTAAPGVIVAQAISAVLVFFGYRRQAAHKAVFNVSVAILEAVVAARVYFAVLGSHSPVSRAAWGAAALALLAAQVASYVATAAVFCAAAGPGEIRNVVSTVPTAAVVTLIDTCLALMAVFVLWVDPLGGVLLGALTLMLGAGYEVHQRMRRRQSVLERVYDFTQAVNGHDDVDELLRATLTAARETMAARRAELWLRRGGSWLHYETGESGVTVTNAERPAQLERLALAGGDGILVPRGRRSEPVTFDLESRDAEDAITVPFQGTDVEGALTVLDRLNPLVTFVADDLRALTNMAAHATVALHSALLLDRLAREVEEKEYLALHDSLTGLANRALFATKIDELVASANGDGITPIAVMLIDLDSFKDVNDTLGHAVGDVVLKATAARLRVEVGRRGTVARLGGDEFGVIIDADTKNEALRVAHDVKRSIEQPIEEDDLLIETRASIGVAMFPEHGDSAATLLRLADVAMYAAKQHHTGVALYEARHDHYSPRRLTLAGELRQALDSRSLTLAYQPQEDLDSGAITAVEALVRWSHPRHGMVPPDEFIPVAEQTGLIVPLTDYVMTEALAQQARWRRRGIDLNVAVNVSPRVVQDGHLPALVAERLAGAGVLADRLTLELTETGLASDPARVAAILHQLARMGVRISIDDFGTGYSSLSRLSDLPVSEVKIDKSFVFAMADGGLETVVRSIVDLGHNLNLRVVAEGVEEPATRIRLGELRCHAIQGHVLCRAVAAPVLEAWISDRYTVETSSRVIVPLRKPRGSGRAG